MADAPIDLRSADINDLKGRDLSPAVVARAKAPKPTWFVRRSMNPKRGEILAVEEKEAWDIINNRSEWKRRDFEFIGYSDGKTFKRIVEESISGAQRLEPEISAAKIEIEKYRRAEERLIIDEAVDMDGPEEDTTNEVNKQKVKRLRIIIQKLEDKLEAVEKEYRTFTSDLVRTAEKAELEVAIENWSKERVWPGAVNIHTPGVGNRERGRILGAMNQGGYG